jgi:hypothetical protein
MTEQASQLTHDYGQKSGAGIISTFLAWEATMNLLWVVVIVLLVLAFVGAPGLGPWNHSYGWYPSGGVGLIVIILIVLLLMGRL